MRPSWCMRVAGSVAALAVGALALPKVSKVGKYLYTEDGNRFYFKGLAYQQRGQVDTGDQFQEPSTFIDPLAHPNYCERDLPYFQQLGINTIRVYSVDPNANHDQCMSMLSNAGIYVFVDLSQPLNGSMSRANPTWTSNLLDLFLQTIDTFVKYDNVIGFNCGNEVARDVPSSIAAAYVKAAARDIKAYMAYKQYSQLIGYACTDGTDWMHDFAQFLWCGNESVALDIFGLNNYEWKGTGNAGTYANTNAFFQNAPIPLVFSEYGAAVAGGRSWTEVPVLFGDTMTDIWSGGIAFSYFQSSVAGFALVNISDDGSTVIPLDDFGRLQEQYSQVTFINSPAQADVAATTYPACTVSYATDPDNFLSSLALPPTPNQDACNCAVKNAFRCVFAPQTTNQSAVEAPLFAYVCDQLNQMNSTACSDLASNSTTGVYGVISGCDPSTQLSYVFSAFYDANGQNSVDCDFGGNATINTAAPTDVQKASAAAQSCLAAAQEVTTPTGVVEPIVTSTDTASGADGGGGNGSASRIAFGIATVAISVAFACVGALFVAL